MTPDSPLPPVTEADALHARKLLERAREAMARRDWDEAVLLCRQSVSLMPDWDGQKVLAAILEEKGDLAGARQAWERGAQLTDDPILRKTAKSQAERLGANSDEKPIDQPVSETGSETAVQPVAVSPTPASALVAPGVAQNPPAKSNGIWKLALVFGLTFLFAMGVVLLLRRPAQAPAPVETPVETTQNNAPALPVENAENPDSNSTVTPVAPAEPINSAPVPSAPPRRANPAARPNSRPATTTSRPRTPPANYVPRPVVVPTSAPVRVIETPDVSTPGTSSGGGVLRVPSAKPTAARALPPGAGSDASSPGGSRRPVD